MNKIIIETAAFALLLFATMDDRLQVMVQVFPFLRVCQTARGLNEIICKLSRSIIGNDGTYYYPL